MLRRVVLPMAIGVGLFCCMRWVGPALLHAAFPAVPAHAVTTSDGVVALDKAWADGLANAMVIWAPWVTLLFVGVPTVQAWCRLLWRARGSGSARVVVGSGAVVGGPAGCPRCGAHMITRVARRGSFAGQSFLGCSQFPTCRGKLPL